jgi:DNA-binding beta-propeller fold protein YncE
VDPITGVQTVITSGGSLQRPIGLAVESDGSSLVVVDPIAKKLVRVSLPGGVQTDISSDPQFIQPTHVAIEADGNYIVSDGKATSAAGERRIYRVDRNTGVATLLVSDGFFQQPRGVAIAR